MRFGHNGLCIPRKARFAQILLKAYCFHVLAWILVRQSDYWLWNVEKCDLVKTSSAFPEKHVLYNFHGKPTAFTYCLNFSPVERFLDLKRWKMRFGQNVLRMAWKALFVQFSYKAYCFHVLAWISVPQSDFWLWNVEKCDLVKTSSAWAEKDVLYNFHRNLLFSRIGVNFSLMSNFWLQNVEKCDLAKRSSAWHEKHVLYNFRTKPTVFTYWRGF